MSPDSNRSENVDQSEQGSENAPGVGLPGNRQELPAEYGGCLQQNGSRDGPIESFGGLPGHDPREHEHE